MKKTKILTAVIIGIAVVIIGILVAMIATGKFTSLKDAFTDTPVSTTQPETTTEVITVTGRPKSALPEAIVAAVYYGYSDKSAADLAQFDKNGFNTVIFELTAENITDVAALLETAAENSLYFGVRADVSQDSGFLTAFTKEYNTDFIIIFGLDETLSDFSDKASTLCEEIKAIDPAMSIGIEPVFTSKAADSLAELTDSKKADFVFLCHESGKDSVFEAAQAVWNEESSPLWLCHDLTGLSAFTTDKAAATVELIAASADMSMCRGLAFIPYGDITAANGAAADIVMNYIKERDTYLLDKDFSLTSHKNTNITVEQSTITFRGTSSPAHELKCNGQVLKVAKNGDFAIDISLKAGANTIKFEHKGKTYTYTVTYKIKLLKSVSPSESITVLGGMQVEVTAVAHKKADLTVEFNGKTYKMTATGESADEESTIDEASDFTTFSATLNTPESKSSVQKLGKYKVTAKYNSLSETLSGASINVSAIEIVTPPPTTKPTTTTSTSTAPSTVTATQITTDADSSTASSPNESTGTTASESTSTEPSANAPSGDLQKYNYAHDYGLGTAKICEIIDDYVETYPGNNSKTFSVPDCSPLLKGTVDYVKGEVICDNDTYYVLASGVKVPKLREEKLSDGKEGKVTHVSIKSGYVMPKNTIKVLSCSAASGDTVIVLEMNRNVAFNAKLTGQTYSFYNNNPNRPVVVSSLNCTGLEFTFSDTVETHGSLSLINSVCKAGSWSTDSANSTATLSFTLTEKGKFYGFHYEYDRNGNLVITIKHKPASLSGYTIMLDPGHGGLDVGAICAVSSASYGYEKNLNLSIATKVKELLEAEGANVIMTRSTDKWVCYTDRNSAVRERNPDMFISIHCDSSTSASAMGTSAYYYRAYSQPLAKAIHESLVNAYKTQIYTDAPAEITDKISRGANFYAFRVARVEECPAILIEYGFVSNPDECSLLQTPANRDILAAATVEGIKKYVSVS